MGLKVIFVSLIICFINSLALAKDSNNIGSFKPGSEPNGFRNLVWGATVFNLEEEDFQLIKNDSEEKIYVKENENYLLDGIHLDRIEYCFWRDRFYKVNLYIDKPLRRQRLLHNVFRKIGYTRPSAGCYHYKGDITGLVFCSPKNKNLPTLSMYSLLYFFKKAEDLK
ncbi:MAG: hypothetical protein KBB01_07705 [Candidatus Omnitrophica bacterium]|jgi:hypothetical protein|nr:hypothetical protein [Candidatus Omnitrophota bacterium]